MGEVRFMISEAAKQVAVESHVLRYWEEELDLVIGRTEMGHRYYTKDDIQLFCCIKKLKDEGMLLKDLKPLIPELRETRLKLQNSGACKTEQQKISESQKKAERPEKNIKKIQIKTHKVSALQSFKATEEAVKSEVSAKAENNLKMKETSKTDDTKKADTTSKTGDIKVLPTASATATTEVSALSVAVAEVIPATQLEQVRTLIGDVLTEVVTANNETLKQDLGKSVTQNVMREMDFLFQAKERQAEEHFRKLDCLIRQQQAIRREAAHESPFGKLRKMLT